MWGYAMELAVLCRSTWGTGWAAFTHLSLVDTPNIWCAGGGRGARTGPPGANRPAR